LSEGWESLDACNHFVLKNHQVHWTPLKSEISAEREMCEIRQQVCTIWSFPQKEQQTS